MTDKIDANLVRHIARLSRIDLRDDEVQAFTGQLDEVIGHFDKLQELDTEGVTPMPHAVELTNVLADDQPREGLATEAALANAPAREGDYFKVPKVLGEGS